MDLLLGRTLSDKIRMTINIWLHDWRTIQIPSPGDWLVPIHEVDEEIILNTFRDLSPQSLEEVERFYYFRKFYIPEKLQQHYFYNWHRVAPGCKKAEKKFYRELKKYKHMLPSNILGGAESVLYHHGLTMVPQAVHDYIRGGIFCDAGACYGDSALVFQRPYVPGKVVSFEPCEENRNVYTENMRLNKIPKEKYILIPCGLGSEQKTICCRNEPGGRNNLAEAGNTAVEVKKLDEICKEASLSNIKLIKADIEGMGLQMVLGAEQTIRRERPVLLLSIYHNQEEFFGIYQTLKQWDLKYRFSIRHCHYMPGCELTLIGYPEELTAGKSTL